ncbi:MAG: rhomboid family intramembrane serine protease [Phycisphaeraceae bacterium]|nr:rhomboid family intramembrane serine protease [Phycisphaeraceae bacterium]
MLLIPLRTDRRLASLPWVNITLIACNVLVFALQSFSEPQQWRGMLLNPLAPSVTQFLSYQFLHHDFFHLLSNMIFLWAFGNNVEDRLGKVGYLLFYLAGGTLAGIGHCLGEVAPVLGASGSVAAVTGAFLVLFPNTRTTILYWLLIFGVFEISSMLLIGFQIAQNLYMLLLSQESHYAYIAHLSGYGYGILVAWTLLWARLLRHEPYDLMGVYLHHKRRVAFTKMTHEGISPWEHIASDTPVPDAMSPSGSPSLEKNTQNQQIALLRSQVSHALEQHDLPQAARFYAQLLHISPKQIMSLQQQLDLANQLMTDSNHAAAANAYELYLNAYSGSQQRHQVNLLLGLIYTRYIKRHQRARELLLEAQRHHTDDNQKQFIKSLLAELPQTF